MVKSCESVTSIFNGAKLITRRLANSIQHPFPLLLWVEWFLIGLNLLEVGYSLWRDGIVEDWFFSSVVFLAMPAAILCIFAALGLWIPHRQATWRKIAYTLAELGLLSLISVITDGFVDYSLSLIVVVIRSCVIFTLPGRLVTVGLTLSVALSTNFLPLLFFPEQFFLETWGIPEATELVDPVSANTQLHSFLIRESLGQTLYFGVILVFVLLLTNALASERQGRQRLAIAHEQLRQYALRIEDQATIEERNRIAREIHDSLGHLLTAQKIQLNNALAFLPEDPSLIQGKGFIREGKQLGVEALKELRRSLKMLRSDPLKMSSLEQLLEQLVERFNRNMDLKTDCQLQIDIPISDEVKRAVYRIVEEALNNIYKHSRAQQITLQVGTHLVRPYTKKAYLDEIAAPFYELWFIITDDGQGFEMSQTTSGFGLRGMHERALDLGGQLRIQSKLGEGCQIIGKLPLTGLLPEKIQ